MALSFQKLKKLQEEAGAQKSSKLNQLFSTHPDLDARIQRMEERATSEGIEKPANGIILIDILRRRACIYCTPFLMPSGL